MESIDLVGATVCEFHHIHVHVQSCMCILFAVFMSPECAIKPPWRLIYTTPYGKNNIVLVAVDEAHCIEDWLVTVYTTYKYIYTPAYLPYLSGVRILGQPLLNSVACGQLQAFHLWP